MWLTVPITVALARAFKRMAEDLAAGRVRLRAVWLPRAALLSGAGLLLLLALFNPDAWIAHYNLDRYDETGKTEWTRTSSAPPSTELRTCRWPRLWRGVGLGSYWSGGRRSAETSVVPWWSMRYW